MTERLLQEGKVRIEHWSEDMDDPWEVADKAESAFRASGLRPMNSKELGFVAFDEDDNPIGATYHQTRQQPAEDFGGPEDEFVTVFEFDVGVDPKHQGGVVGWMLCKAAIQSARYVDADLIRNWVINPKMADMLERLFGFEHEGTPQHGDGYSSHMVKWLNRTDTSVTESIKCAAIRYGGKIYTGNTHFECYTNAAAAAGIDPEDRWAWVESRWDGIVQDDGFLTNDGRFLNREEAHAEAVASRQIASKEEKSLDSEDLPTGSRADDLIRSHT
jgi:GNAT superfamily N-acetyltransferase